MNSKVENLLKREERRQRKEERMKAKGTWKNNPDYKKSFNTVIKHDPIISSNKDRRPKRLSQLSETAQENVNDPAHKGTGLAVQPVSYHIA